MLNNRHFQVKVEDSYTDLLPVSAGVPQGSVDAREGLKEQR
jgi:hypothetical protein